MKIGVLIKQVPDTEVPVHVRSDGSGIEESCVSWAINPYDEYAIEEALRLKEKLGGEVVVITAGPVRADDALRKAMAMGADRAIRIDVEANVLDAALTARLLAAVSVPESFDILFAGKMAVDDEQAAVPAGVAERLRWPHVSPVEEFSIDDEGRTVRLTRPTAGSTKQRIESTLPILIACEKGLNEPRFVSLPGMMKAKRKPLDVRPGAELSDEMVASFRPTRFEAPPERDPCRMIAGEPAEAAAELVRMLRDEDLL